MVVGLVPILFLGSWVLGVLALVFGLVARGKAKRDPSVSGKGMGTWGAVLGAGAIALGIAGVMIVDDVFQDLGDVGLDSPGQSESSSGTRTVPLGTPITVAGTQYRALSARTAQTVGGEFDRTRANGRFVIVEMELTNRRSDTRTIVSEAMRLKTRNGRLYSPDDDASLSIEKPLILDDIQPDVPKQGTLVYDVPAGQISGAKLRVEDLFSDAHGFISLKLSGADADEQSVTPPGRTDPGDQGVTPPSGPGGDSDTAAAEEAVTGHWDAIEGGDYEGAYSYLSANQQSTFSQAGWVREHEQDALTSADVQVVASDVGTSTATVNLLTLRTEAVATGCKDWSGHYQMVKEAGAWKIDKAKLTPSSC